MIPSLVAFFADQTYPQAKQYLDRMASTDADLRTHIRTLIEGIVDDGNWTLLDKLTVAQIGEPDSLLNLVSASFPSVNMNAATFTANAGFTTAYTGSKYLKSGFTEDGSTKLSESNSTQFVYKRSVQDEGVMFGGYNGNSYPEWITDSASSSTVYGYTQAFTGASAAYSAGFQAASRTDASTVHTCSKRTTATLSVAAVAKTSPYYEYYLGVYNNKSALPPLASDWSDGQYAAHGCGSGMTPSQLLLLEARLQTYFTSRGTAV